MRAIITRLAGAACLLAGVLAAEPAAGNAGPFVVHLPNGDFGSNGASARLDSTLEPAREARLRVIKEDLTFDLGRYYKRDSPAVHVTAAYTIENPSGQRVQVDYGFPILHRFGGRGVYVTVDKQDPAEEHLDVNYLDGSLICAIIRLSAAR